jgi:spoIIIJ-associated protein
MKRVAVKRGRTVDEAVEAALAELGARRDEAEIEVLEEPTRGLFGLLAGREAQVRVTVAPSRTEVAADLLTRVAAAMGVIGRVSVHDGDPYALVRLDGDDVGLLIGHRGQTLEALQYLMNVAASRAGSGRQRIIVDVGQYRERREETLKRLAQRVAARVKEDEREIALEAMSPHERRVIHLALQDDPRVTTRSEGEEPFRHVVVCLR